MLLPLEFVLGQFLHGRLAATLAVALAVDDLAARLHGRLRDSDRAIVVHLFLLHLVLVVRVDDSTVITRGRRCRRCLVRDARLQVAVVIVRCAIAVVEAELAAALLRMQRLEYLIVAERERLALHGRFACCRGVATAH